MMIIMMCAAFERRQSTDQEVIGGGKVKGPKKKIVTAKFPASTSRVLDRGVGKGKSGRVQRNQMCFNKHIQGLHQLFLKES